MKNIYISCIVKPFLQFYQFLPYVGMTLKSYCESIPELQNNFEWKLLYTYDSVENMMKTIIDPDIFGISCYVWNHNRQIKLAQAVKNKYPNCLIVAGGPHIPDNALAYMEANTWLDLAFHGEGEIAFETFLKEYLTTKNWNNVPGITHRGGFTRPTQKLPKNMNYPSPFNDDTLKIVNEIKSKNLIVSTPWETNRGCPYSCSFCDWGSDTMSKIRIFPDERLEMEMEWFGKNSIDFLHITDANYGILPRDKEIMSYLINVKQRYDYPKSFYITYAKNSNDRVFEIGKMTEEANLCFGVTLSVQSMNDNVLKNISRDNIDNNKILTLMKKYNQNNIPVYSDFIIGLPGETLETFLKGVADLMKMGMTETIRFYPCAILPNAPMNAPNYRKIHGIKSIERNILFTDDEKIEIVISTRTMSENDWIEMCVLSSIITAFQSGGLIRYLNDYLFENEQKFSYEIFYTNLLAYINDSTGFLKELVNELRMQYKNIIDNSKSNSMAIYTKNINNENITLLPYIHFWLQIALNKNIFYNEIENYLKFLGIKIDHRLSNLLKWQNDLIIDSSYNWNKGLMREYDYNFNDYFSKRDSLKRIKNKVIYHDKFLGPGNRTKIEWKNLREFILCVTGSGSPYTKYFTFNPAMAVIENDSNNNN